MFLIKAGEKRVKKDWKAGRLTIRGWVVLLITVFIVVDLLIIGFCIFFAGAH